MNRKFFISNYKLHLESCSLLFNHLLTCLFLYLLLCNRDYCIRTIISEKNKDETIHIDNYMMNTSFPSVPLSPIKQLEFWHSIRTSLLDSH